MAGRDVQRLFTNGWHMNRTQKRRLSKAKRRSTYRSRIAEQKRLILEQQCRIQSTAYFLMDQIRRDPYGSGGGGGWNPSRMEKWDLVDGMWVRSSVEEKNNAPR